MTTIVLVVASLKCHLTLHILIKCMYERTLTIAPSLVCWPLWVSDKLWT